MKDASNPTVVVDSSLIVDLLNGSDLPDPPVNRVWKEWENSGTQIVSLELLGFEVSNALYKGERRDILSTADVDDQIRQFLKLPIAQYSHHVIAARALEIARYYTMGRTYDPSFVALAELLGCELWTTDRTLYRTVSHHFPFVKVPG